MDNTVQALNRLLALHGGSLPLYLASAPPHLAPCDLKGWEVVEQIIEDQRQMMDKIADLVEESDGVPNRGEFPAEFTGMHDLSMGFMLRNMLSRQHNEIQQIEAISSGLTEGSAAQAVAQEALGAAKGHAQSLQECLATPA